MIGGGGSNQNGNVLQNTQNTTNDTTGGGGSNQNGNDLQNIQQKTLKQIDEDNLENQNELERTNMEKESAELQHSNTLSNLKLKDIKKGIKIYVKSIFAKLSMFNSISSN